MLFRSDPGIPASTDVNYGSQIVDAKCKIFREAFPHIQFAGNSFEIVSMGQALLPIDVGSTNLNVLASQKVSVTVNLKELLGELAKKWVKDPINIGKNIYTGAPLDATSQLIKAYGDLREPRETVQQIPRTDGKGFDYVVLISGNAPITVDLTKLSPQYMNDLLEPYRK